MDCEGLTDRTTASIEQGDGPLWDVPRLQNPHAQQDKARRVRQMFDRIAPTYRRVNRLASAGRDRQWRRQTVMLADVRPGDVVLDIACGTGDLADAFSRAGARRVAGLDFASQMLQHRCGQGPRSNVWIQGDALMLPFGDASFDITCCAFGVRNFQSLEIGLGEMHRVLKPGGRCMILEFDMPRGPLLGKIYGYYFSTIMPILARCVSRDKTGAYRYLPSSVMSFMSPPELVERLRQAGFAEASATARTGGIVHIYRADKRPCSSTTEQG